MRIAARRAVGAGRAPVSLAALLSLAALASGACSGPTSGPDPAEVVAAYLDALSERRWEAAQSLASGELWLAFDAGGAALERLPRVWYESRSLRARRVAERLAEVRAAALVRVGARSAPVARRWAAVFRLYRTAAGWRVYRVDAEGTKG